MSSLSSLLGADSAWALYDDEPFEGAFELNTANGLDKAIVTSVVRPWLFGFKASTHTWNNRSVLILGGGGYVELMVGREGIQVAKWLARLGFDAYVLVHRFPNEATGSRAPVDDARRALELIREGAISAERFTPALLGVCGLSSGGHLAASLLSEYPAVWTNSKLTETPKLDFAIIGYAPISTNAKGRQIIPNKPDLEPQEKQALYDVMQPDVLLKRPAPPTFIVYAGNDSVVPVTNAYRLGEAITKAGAAVELHVFADAPHGFAIDTEGLPVSEWTDMCERWLRQGGFLR